MLSFDEAIEIIKNVPRDIRYYIIPFTYSIQNKNLLEDIKNRHYFTPLEI